MSHTQPDRRVKVTEYGVINADAIYSDYPNSRNSEHAWSHEKFIQKLKIQIVKYKKGSMEMEFDLIGIHAAIANALRRVLISEVPSMAIEKVHMYNNTSIIQDEVLAHRLGLIPLKADQRMFEYRQKDSKEFTAQDSLEFELKIKCVWNPNAPKDSANPEEIYKDSNVYTRHMKWIPIGEQKNMYQEIDIGPVHEDILIAKLRPGQELDLKLYAVKGIGQDHAKFSPVCTAFYRLLPEITLTRDVFGEDAVTLKKCFSPGVIEIEQKDDGLLHAKVVNARYDTCSRNVFRYNELKDSVEMYRKHDHFIFTIESVGALTPDLLFIEAAKILKNKCRTFLNDMSEFHH